MSTQTGVLVSRVLFCRFPFDDQTCEIHFVSILYLGSADWRPVWFVLKNDSVDLRFYTENSGWTINEAKVKKTALLCSFSQQCGHCLVKMCGRRLFLLQNVHHAVPGGADGEV